MSKILLVEDNEMNRDMLSRRLEKRGFDVSIAEDGEEAVSTARELLPDLILMDLSLPKMDGWEASKILKSEEPTSGIPIIALTAHALGGDEAAALKAGCNSFTTKPVNLDELLSLMKELLNGEG